MIATSRPRRVSVARYTSPIPPSPIFSIDAVVAEGAPEQIQACRERAFKINSLDQGLCQKWNPCSSE